MSRTLFVIPMLLAAVGMCHAQQSKTDERRRAEALSAAAAVRLMSEDNDAGAEPSFKEAIAADQTYAEPRYNLGILAERRGDWANALRWYREFLSIDQTSPTAAMARARLARVSQMAEVSRTPEGRTTAEYEVHLAKAKGYLESDQPTKAVSEAETAERLAPSRFEATAVRAAALARDGQYDQAAQAVERALTLAPPGRRDQLRSVQSDLAQERKLGSAIAEASRLMSGGDYKQGADAFGRAAALDPKREDLKLSEANAYLLAGNQDAGTKLLNGLAASSNRNIARDAVKTLLDLQVRTTETKQTNATLAEVNKRTDEVASSLGEVDELAFGIHAKGIAPEFRAKLLDLLRQGKKIRDLEFCGGGMVVLYGVNEHLAYKVGQPIDAMLTQMEKQYQDPIRKFRCAGDGSYIAIYGNNGWNSAGLSENLLQSLRESNGQKERFTDIALFGNDSFILIRDDNGYTVHGVPQPWIDSLKKINESKWTITQVMEGSGDNGEGAFVGLIGTNGYTWNNAPQDMVEEWKIIIARNRAIQCFAMDGNSWVLIEAK